MDNGTPPTDTNSVPPAEPGMLAHELLAKLRPIADELQVSRKKRVQHTKFNLVFTEILRVHRTLPPGYLIVVIGCTGVGKTTLREVLEDQLRNHCRAIATPKDEVPVVSIDLKLEAEKGFIWRRFYIAQLRHLPEPMMTKKVDLRAELRRLRNSGVAMRGRLQGEEVGVLRDL